MVEHSGPWHLPVKDGEDEWNWADIRDRCKREALRIVRRHHDAEEVVQEAMARAWRGRASCRTPEAPMPWCLQITRNEAVRLLGRRVPSPRADPAEGEGELVDARSTGDAERALERLDVLRALEALTPSERLLVYLRYERDCSHPDIAARFGIPEATARVRLHRVHQRLKPLL